MRHWSPLGETYRSPADSRVLGHPVIEMTRRNTPVGFLVLALVGLIAVGCSAPTSAVLQALLGPDRPPLSTPEVGIAAPAAVGSEVETWWPHPDGYAMDLPPGWIAVAVDADRSADLLAAIASSMPGLATRIGAVIDASDVRLSAVAAAAFSESEASPMLVVLVQPTLGMRAREVKSHVREQIIGLPGLTSQPISAHDVVLNAAKAVRFDYTIDDPDVGELSVRSYLFRFGRQAYLVNFIAGPDVSEDVEAIFDEIADSLRFGV